MGASGLYNMLRLCIDHVDVKPADEYAISGVYSFGRGLFERRAIAGTETSYKKLHRLHSGQLVVSRLKAFEGAVAVVPPEFDGWYLSPEFPTFECVKSRLDPSYLAHVCRWPEFWSIVAGASRGIGARRERVDAEGLLRLELNVPLIDEQRRVAARLGRVSDRSNGLRTCCDRAEELAGALAVSASTRRDLDDIAKGRAGWRRSALGEFLTPSRRQVGVDDGGQYQIAGIYSFGRGLIDRGSISGSETSYRMLTVLDEGDVVFSKLNGWEGAVAVVDATFAGHCVSSEFPTFKPDRAQLLPDFFGGIAKSPWFWEALNANTRGSMVRRRRINSTEFLITEVWLPPLDEQARVARLLSMLDGGQRLRRAAKAMIDALVPAALNEAFAGLS